MTIYSILPKMLRLICGFLVLFASMVAVSQSANQDVVNTDPTKLIGRNIKGITLTPNEARMLEPVCVLVLSSGGSGRMWYEAVRDNPILNHPLYNMAKGATSLHHYCYGEVANNHNLRESDPQKRKYLIERMLDEYGFVIRSPEYRDKDWPYLKKVYVAYGRAASLNNNRGEAIRAFSKALEIDPGYVQANLALADLMLESGDRKGALNQIINGLKHNPNSNPLKRRYDKLGGTPPYPEPYQKQVDPEPLPAQEAAAGNVQSKGDETMPKPPQEPPSSSPKPLQSEAPPPSGPGTGHSPSCRFCP